MDIQNLVIAHHHINLVRAMKDYHIRHYVWEIAKVFIPVFLTGFITVVVMRANDSRNKKRWLNDSFVKHQNDLIIKVNTLLIDFFDKFSKYFNAYDVKTVDIKLVNGFFDKYASEIEELQTSYYQLLEMYKIKITPLINSFSQLDFVNKYVKANIESNPDKSSIILPDAEEEIDFEDYLLAISSDLSQAKEAMIKVIQKKLR
ncbi:MAG: hypothetical protein WCY19_06070 [Candidatus Gastranaerophilaceae bacterium]